MPSDQEGDTPEKITKQGTFRTTLSFNKMQCMHQGGGVALGAIGPKRYQFYGGYPAQRTQFLVDPHIGAVIERKIEDFYPGCLHEYLVYKSN